MKLIIYLALVLPFAAITTATSEEGGSVEGYVSGDLSYPMQGVLLRLDSSAKGIFLETTTNSSGYYLFSNVSPGAYSIEAEVKDIGCIIYPKVPVSQGQRVRRDFQFLRLKRPRDNCQPVSQ